MTASPLVSIVTPCLNPGHRLQRCVESVRVQDYPKIQHIVIDGESSDNTVNYLRSERDLTWTSEPDRGQAAAINKGFRQASGSIIAWLNADDILLPGAVSAAVQAFSEEPSICWTYGNCRVVTSSGNRLWIPPSKLRERHVEFRNPAPQPGSFFAASAIAAIGGLDESFSFSMDLDLFLRLFDFGPNRHIPQTLAQFEIHADSKTGSVPRSRWLEDSAQAWHKNGRFSAAAVALGRTIPLERPEDVMDRRALGDAASTVRTRWEHQMPRLEKRDIIAGAKLEAAMLEVQLAKQVRHLFPREVWACGVTRRQVLQGLWRRLRLRRRGE